MKLLVIPDIHLKPWIIENAMELMASGMFDNAVFLGDFVDDWGNESNLGLYEMTFDALDKFLEKYPDTLICLGNHDLSYLWLCLETGYSWMARDLVVERVRKLGGNKKAVHWVDKVLFSHAGVTDVYMKKCGGKLKTVVNKTNHNINPDLLWHDCSPIWARPGDYSFKLDGYLQIVGHTPVGSAHEMIEGLVVCDTFSTYRDGSPIGDLKYVVVDTETGEWSKI